MVQIYVRNEINSTVSNSEFAIRKKGNNFTYTEGALHRIN